MEEESKKQFLIEYAKLLKKLEKTKNEYDAIQRDTEFLKSKVDNGECSRELSEKIEGNLALYKVYEEKFERINLKVKELKERYNK